MRREEEELAKLGKPKVKQPKEGGAARASVGAFAASNVDDAILLLSDSTAPGSGEAGSGSGSGGGSGAGVERHPERRAKAAYAAFEERQMAKLKKDYPGLRLSQLKQMLHKMWQKSPDNPFNQLHVEYNAKAEDARTLKAEVTRTEMERLRVD